MFREKQKFKTMERKSSVKYFTSNCSFNRKQFAKLLNIQKRELVNKNSITSGKIYMMT